MNANELVGELVADHKAEIIEKAANKLAARLAKVCLPDAEKLFREKINEAATQRAKEALDGLSGSVFYDTDSYGCRRSNIPLTLVDIIRREAHKWLQTKVDYRGGTSSSRSDNTRGQYLATKAAEELIKGELAPAIEQAKKDLKAEVESTLSRTFVDTLRKLK